MFDRHLYIIAEGGNTGYVKIGSARDVNKRVAELQTGSSSHLFVYAIFYKMGNLESYCHSKLSKDRRSGEWFRYTADTEVLISELISKATEKNKKYHIDSRWTPSKGGE